MAMDENYVRLIGNVGSEPEVRQSRAGDNIGHFSLCTSDRWKDKQTGEWRQKPEWHRITVFDPVSMERTVSRLGKGDRVEVEGKLVTNKWQDKQGNDRYTTEVQVTKFRGRVLKIDWPKSGKGNGGEYERYNAKRDGGAVADDGGYANQEASGGGDEYNPDDEDMWG